MTTHMLMIIVAMCACRAPPLMGQFLTLTCACAGDVFNIIADHLSHNRLCDARRVARSELGVSLRRLPSHEVN